MILYVFKRFNCLLKIVLQSSIDKDCLENKTYNSVNQQSSHLTAKTRSFSNNVYFSLSRLQSLAGITKSLLTSAIVQKPKLTQVTLS